jgi:hypothetical protein
MPEITSQAKIFRDWEGLLGACTQNAALLPGMDPLKTNLETLLAQVKDLKVQQENLGGNKQATTQRLTKAIEEGREAARKLRALVLINLGSDSKHLTQFGVAPRQKKGRKAKPTPGTPAPAVTGAHETAKPADPNGQ